MTVFVDTNVLLDVLARREPFYGASVAIWTLAEQGKVTGLVSAISFTNIFYIVRKTHGRAVAQKSLILIRDTFGLVACDSNVINQAVDADLPDFEDAVQYFSAARAGADCIITRDQDRFPKGELNVLTPAEFLAGRII